MKRISLLILSLWAYYAQAQRDLFLVTTQNDLFKFNPASCQANRVGTIQQAGGEILDIAVCPTGKMYVLTLTHLHEINPDNARIIGSRYLQGPITGTSPNALTCDKQNRLYAASFFRTDLYTIDPGTGQSTVLGNMGYGSAGDLSILDDNTLLLTSHGNQLIRVNKANGQSSPLTTINANTTIYGTISVPSPDCANASVDLIAFGGTDVYRVNSQSLQATQLCSGITPGIVTGAASLDELTTQASSTKTSVSYQVCQPNPVDLTQFVQGQPGGGQFSASQQAHMLSGSTVRFEPTTPIGEYIFTYQTGTGNCSNETTIRLAYKYVNLDLGNSVFRCANTPKTIGTSPLPGTYTYAWNTGATSPSISVNNTGTYTLTVQNGSCSYTRSITVQSASIQLTDLQILAPHCNKSDGGLTIVAQGGSQLSFQLNDRPIQPAARFDNLATGHYTLTIRNAEGCSASQAIELAPVSMPIIEKVELIAATCGLANGQLRAKASNGSGALLYSLDGQSFQADPVFTNIKEGNYQVLVRDQEGCQAVHTVTLDAKPAPTIAHIATLAPTCGLANGQVMVRTNGGYGKRWYSLDGKNYQADSVFKQLTGGSFRLCVKDQDDCQIDRPLEIPISRPVTIADLQTAPATCNQDNGSIRFLASGGNGNFRYSLNSQSMQPPVYTNLKAGSYSLVVTDTDGCLDTRVVSIVAVAPPVIQHLTATPTLCDQRNGVISIQATGTQPLLFSADGRTFQRQETIQHLDEGTYTIVVKDAYNCLVSLSIDLAMQCTNTVYRPTGFSPNHDGLNDHFDVKFLFRQLKLVRFAVFNRWGNLMIEKSNLTLESGQSLWDGQVNGIDAPAEMYSYTLDVEFPDGQLHRFSGSVTILR